MSKVSPLRAAPVLAVLLMLAAGPGRADAPISDDGARMEKVGDGIYAILHDNATDEWPHGNTGVVVTPEGILVVDADYLPSRARADIALIRKLTDAPVRYLVYTHWHFDHNNGGIAYREAFPGVKIVSERHTARYIEINGIWWSRMTTAPGSAKRKSLAAIEDQVASGKESGGKPLSEADLSRLRNDVRRRENELRELETLKVVTPDMLFDDELTLALGGRRIEIRNQGPANSPFDVTIYLPDAKVLFTGDILVQDPLPYVGSSWPISWIEVLKRLEAVAITALVPGHGPVQHDHAYTRRVRSFLEAATREVEAMVRQGKTLEQIQESIDLDEVRQGFAPWTDLEDPGDWKTEIKSLSERAWRGVRGQG